MKACGVPALPTFQVYVGGEKVDSFTGGDEAKMVNMVTKHVASGDKKSD